VLFGVTGHPPLPAFALDEGLPRRRPAALVAGLEWDDSAKSRREPYRRDAPLKGRPRAPAR
jgi:hypothetical protein